MHSSQGFKNFSTQKKKKLVLVKDNHYHFPGQMDSQSGGTLNLAIQTSAHKSEAKPLVRKRLETLKSREALGTPKFRLPPTSQQLKLMPRLQSILKTTTTATGDVD